VSLPVANIKSVWSDFKRKSRSELLAHGAPTDERTISNMRGGNRANPLYSIGIERNRLYLHRRDCLRVTSDMPPDVSAYIRQAIPPGEVIPFVLTPPGQCRTLEAYVILFYLQGQLIGRSPAEGAWTLEKGQRSSPRRPRSMQRCVDTTVVAQWQVRRTRRWAWHPVGCEDRRESTSCPGRRNSR
jgi:hypothetical protein